MIDVTVAPTSDGRDAENGSHPSPNNDVNISDQTQPTSLFHTGPWIYIIYGVVALTAFMFIVVSKARQTSTRKIDDSGRSIIVRDRCLS
jgi:hypothetical protein